MALVNSKNKCIMQTGDLVKKQWNDFGFKVITKSDYEAVLAHLQDSYYLDEPMNHILGCPPERSVDLDQRISDVMDLDQGSFYAYPLDKPDQVAAVLLIWFQEKGKSIPEVKSRSALTDIVGKPFDKLLQLYDAHLQKNATVYPELFIVSTSKLYRGKGLATEMYRMAIDQLKSQGYPFVTSTFTNPSSRKIGEKLGFKTMARVDFDECKHPDGSSIFGEAGASHFVTEAVLDLQ